MRPLQISWREQASYIELTLKEMEQIAVLTRLWGGFIKKQTGNIVFDMAHYAGKGR